MLAYLLYIRAAVAVGIAVAIILLRMIEWKMVLDFVHWARKMLQLDVSCICLHLRCACRQDSPAAAAARPSAKKEAKLARRHRICFPSKYSANVSADIHRPLSMPNL